MKNSTIQNHIVSLLLVVGIFQCAGNPEVIEEHSPPGWILHHTTDSFVGMGESSSLEDAQRRATTDALESIRLSVYGGNIKSSSELSARETTFESDETYRKFSELSIDGYVRATKKDSYTERDFAGNEIIFRHYVLMFFNRGEYISWLVNQIGTIEDLVAKIEIKTENFQISPSSETIVELFTYLEMASENYSNLAEVGNNSSFSSEITALGNRLDKLIISLADEIIITPSQSSIIVNPFSNYDQEIELQIIDIKGHPLRFFPYFVLNDKNSESSSHGVTNVDGMVSLTLPENIIPGSILNYRVTPAVVGLASYALPQAKVETSMKCIIEIKASVIDQEGTYNLAQFDKVLSEQLNSSVFLIGSQDENRCILEGNLTLKNTSETYGVYYTQVNVDLWLKTNPKSNNATHISFIESDGGKSYSQASEHVLRRASKRIATDIESSLTKNK